MAHRYVPETTGILRSFHEACVAAGLVTLQRCSACSTFRHPPRHRCAECQSAAHAFVAVSGAGVVHSLVVTHFPFDPAWADDLPSTSVVVELEEGPRIVAAPAAADDLTALRIGDPVVVSIEPSGDAFALFRVARRCGADPSRGGGDARS